MSKILITGAAGFIGYHLSKRLLAEGYEIYGIDNLNTYYDPTLKNALFENLGIKYDNQNVILRSSKDSGFCFHKLDLQNFDGLTKVFTDFNPSFVMNLAAQTGVRYSMENPRSYIESNRFSHYRRP